jgi:hypothetical protein
MLISEFKLVLKGFDYVVSTSMITAKSGRTLSGDQQDQQLNTLDYKQESVHKTV